MHIALVLLLLLLLVGVGSAASVKHHSALVKHHSSARSSPWAVRQEKRLGPKPTPRWYWRWTVWRLGEGFAKGHPRGPNLRPKLAPHRIPHWAWRRLHFFLLARASARKAHGTKHTNAKASSSTASTKATGSSSAASSGVGGYEQAISYTGTRPPFTPTRTVNVATAAQLTSAISNLAAGDLVRATSPFTVSGETIIKNRLSAPAELDLGSYVQFHYSGGGNLPAVWVANAENVRIFGGDVRSDTGSCIVWYGGQHILWWGFHAHDCGGGGLSIATARPGANGYGPIQYDDIEGSVTHFSLTGGVYDPHVENCTGLHGANIADSNYADISHNRFALDVEDSACTGGGISFGASQSTNIPHDNTVILKCVALTFISTIQTGGNCYQTWGYGNQNTDIKYLEADDLTGHAVWAGGLYSNLDSALATNTIEYARATNTDQNPLYTSDCTMNAKGNPRFQDVAPAPCYSPFSS